MVRLLDVKTVIFIINTDLINGRILNYNLGMSKIKDLVIITILLNLTKDIHGTQGTELF